MMMFSFDHTVLLMSVRTGDPVRDANISKIFVQPLVLTFPIRLYGVSFGAKKSFNMGLKLKKLILYIRLAFL